MEKISLKRFQYVRKSNGLNWETNMKVNSISIRWVSFSVLITPMLMSAYFALIMLKTQGLSQFLLGLAQDIEAVRIKQYTNNL